LALLIGAALLEVGGVALVRQGLELRSWIVAAGAASLVAYGVLVNQGNLDFGRLIGSYIVVFFVVSQLMALVLFHHVPAARTLLGGALIVAGGITILG
jgi:small multidrug resistance family-3 protein